MPKIQTQFLSPEDIDKAVATELMRFTSIYGAGIPIDPEKLLEAEYGMQIIPLPGLKALGVDCSLSRDGTTIVVDQNDYENDRMTSRLRFSFAHELGHKILHERYLWNIESLTDQQLEWLERQANMFAAHFLMPKSILLGVIASEVLERFDSIATAKLTLQACVEFRTANLAGYFGVSTDAMRHRIQNIDLREVLKGPYVSQQDKERFVELAAVVEKVEANNWAIKRSPLSI